MGKRRPAARQRASGRLLSNDTSCGVGFAPLSPLERVVLSPRYAWQLRLADGLVIELGRDAPGDPIDARLARLVAVHAQTLGRIQRRLEYVDLRYPNGFALRMPELKGS